MHRASVIILVALSLAILPADAPADAVRVTTVDGEVLVGELGRCQADVGLTLTVAGHQQRIAWDDLLLVEFTSRQSAGPPASGVRVDLVEGGVLFGSLKFAPPGRLAVATPLNLSLELPFALIRVVRRQALADPQVQAQIERAAADRDAKRDTLIVRRHQKITALPVIVEQITADEVSFSFGQQSRKVKAAHVAAVVFASTGLDRPSSPTRATLTDGMTLAGRLADGPVDHLSLDLGRGVVADLPLTSLVRIEQRSGRVVFLSDVDPIESESGGLFGTSWPVRRDRSVTGGPLQLAGQVYRKGLGVHARTRLTYALDGRFTSFAATIGIDDETSGRGNAVFRVIADGKTLFDSGPVRGGRPPREVHVDVSGCRRLTLLVDFGEELDLADHADWANARLIRRDAP